MGLDRVVNISDLQRLARKRLPRVIYDYIEGGVEDERALSRNEQAYEQYRLIPRYLTGSTGTSQSLTLFGRQYDHPFGLAPTGTVGLFRRGGDLMLASAAASANIPYIMSGASNSLLEEAATIAPQQMWYQLYPARDRSITQDLVLRSRDAGLGALVVTVDVPINPKRERNLRNGFSHRMKLTRSLVLDGLSHPRWLIEYLRHGGIPVFENWARYAKKGSSPRELIDFFSSQMPTPQSWRDLEEIRRNWPGPLVVKGILHPADAKLAAECGADGIIVSNHGGRQLDRAPSPLQMLPAIREAVGPNMPLMVDGGIRRGADIVTALCLGVAFVFVGRAVLYGVAAAGVKGAEKAISILANEIDLVLGQIGCDSVRDLGADWVQAEGASANDLRPPAAASRTGALSTGRVIGRL